MICYLKLPEQITLFSMLRRPTPIRALLPCLPHLPLPPITPSCVFPLYSAFAHTHYIFSFHVIGERRPRGPFPLPITPNLVPNSAECELLVTEWMDGNEGNRWDLSIILGEILTQEETQEYQKIYACITYKKYILYRKICTKHPWKKLDHTQKSVTNSLSFCWN